MKFFSCLNSSNGDGQKFAQQRQAKRPSPSFRNITIDRARPQLWSSNPHPHRHERQSKTTTNSGNETSLASCRSNMPDPFCNPSTSFQNGDYTSITSPSVRGCTLNFAKAWRCIRRAVQRRSTSRPWTNLGRESAHSFDWFSWKRCFRPALSRHATEQSGYQDDTTAAEVVEDYSPLTWSRLVNHTAGDAFCFMSPESESSSSSIEVPIRRQNNYSMNHFRFASVIYNGNLRLIRTAVVSDTIQNLADFGGECVVVLKSLRKAAESLLVISDELMIHDKFSSHPNVASLYAFMEDSTWAHLIMEYLRGPDLLSFLESNGAVSERMALQITKSIFDVLAEMHQWNCTHLDIKSANIVFRATPTGEDIDERVIKVIDFGHSERLPSHKSVYKKDCRTVAGTEGYFAPEIIGKNGGYSAGKVDVWSVGCVLTECLLGILPADLHTDEVRRTLLKELKIRKLGPATIRLVRSCLAIEPEDRPTAFEALKTVGSMVNGMGQSFSNVL